MKIAYFSVHAILEYDEIHILRAAGHAVFPFGAYFKYEKTQDFRPDILATPDEVRLIQIFEDSGCQFSQSDPIGSLYLADPFIDEIDVFIIMHDIGLINHHWEMLSRKKVVWRTIGQSIPELEPHARALREKGLSVVRYSPYESRSLDYCGHDAIIRFGKPDNVLPQWRGNLSQMVTFANNFQARYPNEYRLFEETASRANMDAVLGGIGNDDCSRSIGFLLFGDQNKILIESRAYFYCTGMHIPYTLNFIEAWMTGIPTIVLASECGSFYEVPNLINHNHDGFVIKSVDQALYVLNELNINRELAERVGRNGQLRAKSLFGYSKIIREWSDFFKALMSK